jgi:hypothetical protein
VPEDERLHLRCATPIENCSRTKRESTYGSREMVEFLTAKAFEIGRATEAKEINADPD